MKIGIFTQGFVRRDEDVHDRVRQIVKEAELADQLGLHSFGISEQHFKYPTNSGGPIDAILAAVTQATERIRIRPGVIILPLHHPLNVAERWAAIDVLSKGRVDFGMGRGNTALTARAFAVPIPETEERSIESAKIITQAWTQPSFEYEGKYWQIPRISLSPRPAQRPHPPLFWAVTSPASHETAGRLGFNLMTSSVAITWDQIERRIARYQKGLQEAQPFPGVQVGTDISLQVFGHCTTSLAKAREEVGYCVIGFVNRGVGQYAEVVRRTGQTVGFEQAMQFRNNWDAIVNKSPSVFGSPDDCIRSLQEIQRRYPDVGTVEILIDGGTHAQHLECIRLLAKEVMPAFESTAPSPALAGSTSAA